MTDKTILLLITNDAVWLNPEIPIGTAQTNIPFKHLLFRTVVPIYWEAEMLRYDASDARLHLRVINYSVAEPLPRFAEQRPKKEVRALYFEKLDWRMLEPQLSSYTKARLTEQVNNLELSVAEPTRNFLPEIEAPAGTLSRSFSVPFSEAKIGLGEITFECYLDDISRNLTISIANAYLMPEFNLIKPFIAKKLKKKNFKVRATVHFRGGEIERIEAHSNEIKAINEEMLEAVKQQRLQGLTRPPKMTPPDQTLFTSEDIFDTLNDTAPGNPFRQTEKDILDFFSENNSIRNRQQLVFLAGSKQSERQPLRFTLTPKFGFLFFIEGPMNHHFAWELLNSNATYLWSFPKESRSVEQQYWEVAAQINAVQDAGRQQYRQYYRDDLERRVFSFNYIEHKHIGSAMINAFPKWRHKLEELLV
ncbi:MAG: hypothetical protein ABMA02_16000 [Saprospiraceae bacterium]